MTNASENYPTICKFVKFGTAKNLTGLKFGKLKVIGYCRIKGVPMWKCKCECGNYSTVSSANLNRGNTRSCGCLFYFAVTKHGHCRRGARSTEYKSWYAAKGRCLNPNNPQYKSYGGRGIGFCKRWFEFGNFLHDLGIKPSPKH